MQAGERSESGVPSPLQTGEAPPLPLITPQAIRKACRSFPPATAVGVDGLRPRHLLHLDVRGLTVVAAILYVSERAGLLPVEGSNIIFLPKPTGSERPIGLLPTMYRVWCRCRRPVAAERERMHDRKYFLGRQPAV